MNELNVTSLGGLRLGNGTSVKKAKIQKLISLADRNDYIGTSEALAKQLSLSVQTIHRAIVIMRALGYTIESHGKMEGYFIRSRPDNLPEGFEHYRKNWQRPETASVNGTQLHIPTTEQESLCIDKLDKPKLPHVKPFGRGVFIAQDDWVKFIRDTEKIYNEYSSIVDVFNMA